MMRRRTMVGAGLVAVAVIVVLVYVSSTPPSYRGYEQSAAQAADDALSAVLSARLVSRARLDGKILGPYLTVTLDEAHTAAAKAQTTVAETDSPSEATDKLRAEVTPLLDDAVRAVGDARYASERDDTAALGAAAENLGKLGDELDSFVQEHG